MTAAKGARYLDAWSIPAEAEDEAADAALRSIRTASAMKRGEADDEPRGWPEPLDLEALAEQEPEPPKFIVPGWLPCGTAALLAGHGGVGKSAIALYLAVCMAAALSFFGLAVARCRVMYLSCEDRAGVLHWRLSRICAHLGIDLGRLRGWLDIVDLVGHDSVLWERNPRNSLTTTTAYLELQARIRAQGTEVLIVDGISDAFGGNEISRSEVGRFVNSLVGLIPADRGAVLLLGHISKPAVAGNGEGYSGSTAWHNKTRARWYLYPETEQGEEDSRPQKTGDLILELQKSNHGPIDQSMRFRWDDQAHMFTGEAVGLSAFDRKHQDREEQGAILRAIKGCMEAKVTVYAAMQGPYTAFMALSLRPEFPATLKGRNPASKRRFRRQIEQLRQIRAIEETEYRRSNRKTGTQLVLTTEGMRQCAE